MAKSTNPFAGIKLSDQTNPGNRKLDQQLFAPASKKPAPPVIPAQELPVSGKPESRKSETPGIREARNPGLRDTVTPELRHPGNPAIRQSVKMTRWVLYHILLCSLSVKLLRLKRRFLLLMENMKAWRT